MRWALETAETVAPPASPPPPRRARSPALRRHPLPTIVHRIGKTCYIPTYNFILTLNFQNQASF